MEPDIILNDQQFDEYKALVLLNNKIIDMAIELKKMKKEYDDKHRKVKSNSPEYHKQYYRDIEKHKIRDKYKCDMCNCEVSYFSKLAHLNSKKHKSNMPSSE